MEAKLLLEKNSASDLRGLVQRIISNEVAIDTLAQQYRKVIEGRERDTKAFEFLDWDVVDQQIDKLAATAADQRGRLFGLPVAVKDIFDTADMPTTYGSRIYKGHIPTVDAACVARLRHAGAIILGKTVTTEFAYWHAGPTRNPLNPGHTPGGSSSGSCAGLAAGMFPLALGSQTAASTIRPASYCGITGYKPSRQWISRAGVKPLAANSLDAVGVFGKCVDDVKLLASVLAGTCFEAETFSPALTLWCGEEWNAAESYATDAVMTATDKLATAGSTIHRAAPSPLFAGLLDTQKLIMAREAAMDLADEFLNHRAALSDTLGGFLEEGCNISADQYAAALQTTIVCRARIDELFGPADILAAPSTLDEAPLAANGTGNPDMSRVWTLLDLPSITLPVGTGPAGLPLGLQLAARPGQDAKLLGAAKWIEAVLSGEPAPA